MSEKLKTKGSYEPEYAYTAKVLLCGNKEETEYKATSVKKLAQKMNISDTTIRKLLRNEKLKLPFTESIVVSRVPIIQL